MQIQKVDQLDQKQLLHQQKRHDKQLIPLSVTYSPALPSLKDILIKHWHIRSKSKLQKIRLSNHRQDVKNSNAIPVCEYFSRHHHDFNNHGKFIIIELVRNTRTTITETLKERLKQRENFWIVKLETLAPQGLNRDIK